MLRSIQDDYHGWPRKILSGRRSRGRCLRIVSNFAAKPRADFIGLDIIYLGHPRPTIQMVAPRL